MIDELASATKDGVRAPNALDAAKKILAELHELLGDPRIQIPPQRAKSALATLQSHRMFDELTQLADKFLARDPSLLGAISQPYAQGLIDSGRVVAGRDLLQTAINEGTLTASEQAGIFGLLGRAYKQNYVNHVRTAADASALSKTFGPQLKKAIENYERVYDRAQPGTNFWHGINLIALKNREQRDGLKSDDGGETQKLTQDMLAAMLRREPAERTSPDYPWLLASIGEAYLALGNVPKAAEYMALYAQDPGTNAFALGGTIRQLEQVWQIKAGAEGAGEDARRLNREARFGDRQARRDQHDIGLHSRSDVSDATREAIDGSYVPR